VDEARSVIANLRPSTLDDFGLSTAIRMQIEELQTEGFEASYDRRALPPPYRHRLYGLLLQLAGCHAAERRAGGLRGLQGAKPAYIGRSRAQA
jgi:hypothetical protein